MEPWYKVTTPRAEVREGRSFNPDEFAIALEQVVAGTAPEDYRDAGKFFDRTCFTRALNEQLGMVLRRLAGETQGTPPVLSMITQFGGGKTHTLTALYHLVQHAKESAGDPGVQALLKGAGLTELPAAKVAVFVGNAWDPAAGKETPWIDMARQLAGAVGVEALGPKARTSPPGTDSLQKVFQSAGGRVLLLFDEVLNFFNRHRDMADPFYAFLDNVVRAMTGAPGCAAMLSLPRSPVEMTDFDQMWLDRIDKIVHRVAKDLIANDEGEISEVVRRRLFEDLGKDSVRRAVARTYADWCFERRAQLPPEWTAVDTITTDVKGRERLRARFEAAYPFHPATISVFQRKWQGLPHYQRTRGTLAMFAQWISWAGREAFRYARKEPLITLGSAPLQVPEFQAAILGQLGEQRLLPAIEVDIAGDASHAKALDATTKDPRLVDIHRRVGTAILFESTGVATDKAAHLPELRFALGEPDLDSTSIDNAAIALEKRAFFIRRVGTDGYRIGYKPTLKKIVGDRKAGLDEGEVAKAIRTCVKEQFEKGRNVKLEAGGGYVLPWQPLVTNGDDVPDTPKLTLVVADPDLAWDEEGETRKKISCWTHTRGSSQRFYPAALVWIVRKPDKSLREKAEQFLAWKRVAEDLASGILGTEFDASERAEVTASIRDAEEELEGGVWASYRYLVTTDPQAVDGLRVIDLGAGHSSGGVSLGGRVVAALKAEGLLNESVGAGYIERNWPPAHKETGAWPLNGLRQAFLDGSLIRLPDPEAVLRRQIVGFVEKGDFGLGSGPRSDGSFDRVWWKVVIGPEEVLFDGKTFLLKAARAATLQQATQEPSAIEAVPGAQVIGQTPGVLVLEPPPGPPSPPAGPVADVPVHLSLHGPIPPEQWNRLGTRLLPKLRTAGTDLALSLDASLTVSGKDLHYVEAEIRQALRDLGLEGLVRIEKGKT